MEKLFDAEYRLMEVLWEHAPINSTRLVAVCQEKLNWNKSTTYTVLRKLCERGIFQNVDGTVSALISREEFFALQSERFVEENFQGSLPAFLAAFSRRKKLTAEEVARIREMIDACGEG